MLGDLRGRTRPKNTSPAPQSTRAAHTLCGVSEQGREEQCTRVTSKNKTKHYAVFRKCIVLACAAGREMLLEAKNNMKKKIRLAHNAFKKAKQN